jgi:predicted component of type VI protein secretion system
MKSQMYRLKGTAGEVLNRSYPLEGRLLIGRADDCDVRVDGERVAPRHAEVIVGEEGGVTLRSLAPAGDTLLNGEPVSRATMTGGDEIRLGTCRWMLQAPGLKPRRVLTETAVAARPARWPWLLALAAAAALVLAWQRGWLAALAG